MRGELLLLAMAAFAFAACGQMPPIDRAILVHNTFRSVVLDLDAEFGALLKDASESARNKAGNDQDVYLEAMQPWTDAVGALVAARQAEQAMHLAIRQWEATGKDGPILRQTYACAAEALQVASDAFGKLPHGSPLYAAAFAIAAQLREQAAGYACEVKP